MVWVRRGGLALAALVLVAVVVVYGALVSSLPHTSGRIDLPGLYGPVEVARDAMGVPVVTAGNDHDAYLALGFVHAQDRLFQMDFLRRLASGRLAEAVGPGGLPSDRFMRTLGLRRAAEASLAGLDAATRQALEAYAAGVNAFLETRPGLLPPEFLLLRLEPEPWTPVDSLLWQRLMALRLSGNWYEEALRAVLLDTLPPEAVAELWVPPEPSAPVTLGAVEPLPGRALAALMDAWPAALAPTLASNAWVLAGARTANGAPLLANDPHLGLGLPNLWYLAELRTPEWRVSGATVPGVPFHVVGHNGRLAWGLTTTHSDSMDLFIEEPAGDGLYKAPGGPLPFEERRERIAVRGAPEVDLPVRTTRHGPVVGDLLDVPLKDGAVLALSAAALAPDDRTADAMRRLNRAGTWREAAAALASWHAPQQNVMVADSAGTIGFIAPGRVPVRRDGRGLVPRPGADGAFDWTGWLPFKALPRSSNPAEGRFVNANNRPVPDAYPHLLAVHWPEPYRAARIVQGLDAVERADAEAMRALQLDSVSLVFAELWPLMARTPATTPEAADALALLAGWDGRMDVDRPEPLIFTAWRLTLERALFADEMGPAYRRWEGSHPRLVQRVLAGRTRVPWCDDTTTTAATESCADQLAASLEATLASLRAEFDSPEAWRWGDAHAVRLAHPVFRRVPVLDAMTTLRAELSGGEETVNRGGFSARGDGPWRDRLERAHGAGLRAVYDLGDLESAGFVIAAGQSGHPLSPHFADFMEPWREGRLVPIGRTAGAESTVLVLEPLRNTR